MYIVPIIFVVYFIPHEGQQGRQGQYFSLSRPRTCVDEFIQSAVPAVPHQSFKIRLKAEISSVSL